MSKSLEEKAVGNGESARESLGITRNPGISLVLCAKNITFFVCFAFMLCRERVMCFDEISEQEPLCIFCSVIFLLMKQT